MAMFPLEEARALMATMERAGFHLYMLVYDPKSYHPPLHTYITAPLIPILTKFADHLAKGGTLEGGDFTMLYQEDNYVETTRYKLKYKFM